MAATALSMTTQAILVAGVVLAAWALLVVLASERQRRLAELEALRRVAPPAPPPAAPPKAAPPAKNAPRGAVAG